MRKYQQLLLVIVSFISVAILLAYKSENNRLKDILQVVNFFSRNDAAAISRLENSSKFEIYHDFGSPLPVWQRIGDNFHIYSCYWSRNELVPGGEAVGIVVGLQNSIINFKCALRYGYKKILGKFSFISPNMNSYQQKTNSSESFNVYKFLCRVLRDFGEPDAAIFMESKSKIEHEILIKHVKQNKSTKSKIMASICLNLVSTNDYLFAYNEFLGKNSLLQYFFYHQAIGVQEFLVYNGDKIPSEVRKLLKKTGLQINYFPFNFPFDYKTDRTREIIETDCVMRNTYAARFTFLLEPNEFIYTRSNLQFKDSILRSLIYHDKKIRKFEIPTFAVCLDHRSKLYMDNTLYDPDRKINHTIYVFKPQLEFESNNSVKLTTSQMLAHHYTNCFGSKNLLNDWKNSVREDFMQYVQTIRNEIIFLF